MSHVAKISRQWFLRMLITGLVFLAFGGWAIYDGFVHYPRRNQIIETYQEYQETNRAAEWERLAEERGWPAEPDPEDYKTEWDIKTQFIMAALCIPFGLLIMIKLLMKSRQSLATDEAGFKAANGQKTAYSEITGIDRKRWRDKGIADVLYRDRGGREKKARVDAWIFKGGDEVLKDIAEATGFVEEEVKDGEEQDIDQENGNAQERE